MNNVFSKLHDNDINLYLESYSALDKYFNIKNQGIYYIITDASLVNIAQVFDNLEYPGLFYKDASLKENGSRFYFRCVDKINSFPSLPFTAQNLLYNIKSKSYLDPYGVYSDLRRPELVEAERNEFSWFTVMEASKLVSRYHYEIDEIDLSEKNPNKNYKPSAYDLKELLITVLTGSNADKGLDLLYRAGFIEEYLPELYSMQDIEHSKEYHPEGNVWEHTLEALKHRKNNDLTLSAALLLHDIGKTAATGSKEKPFLEHAEIGVKLGKPFLRRLGFSREFTEDVMFLIKYHMLPAAMGKLPVYRMEKALKHPLFPLLLELYRADTSATFRGPEGYYNACRIYRTYLKNTGNPYKTVKRNKPVIN
jgi:poly(A) polymerase